VENVRIANMFQVQPFLPVRVDRRALCNLIEPMGDLDEKVMPELCAFISTL
jgi:hypothetical protein